MSVWDKCWFCEDFDEENECCMYCMHPDDCEYFDAEKVFEEALE